MKAIRILASAFLLMSIVAARGGTLTVFDTSVGPMFLELYDKDKPETVANFIRYIRSGRFNNMFIQRWEPQFVIQGGGYYTEALTNSTSTNYSFRTVQTFGNITNEYSVGDPYSNTYGTIAMARQQGQTNSASSQWFLNLTNNAFLDSVDGGFTVFGKVFLGTNTLNKFYPPPAPNGIYRGSTPQNPIYGTNQYGEIIYLDALPVLSTKPDFKDLVYVNAKVVECSVQLSGPGRRVISWNSVGGITNQVQVSTNLGGGWTVFRDVLGDGTILSVTDSSPAVGSQLYRVQLLFN